MKSAGFSNQAKRTISQGLALASVAVLILLLACAPPGGPGAASAPADKYAHLDAEGKIAMSDVLADDGEEKLTFASMNEAWGLFSEALQVNPENHRAAFWREVLKPILEMKGILARVRPLYLKQQNGLDRYAAILKDLERDADKDYFLFMTNGPNDIDTDEKYLDWTDRLIVSLDTLRIYLRENKDRTLSLRAPVKAMSAANKKKNDKCAALTIMNNKFGGCPETGMLNFKINRADIQVLQYVVSAEMLQLSMIYAYKINPIVMFENSMSRRNFKEKLEWVLQGYDGSLLARNHLALGASVLPDWIVAQKYIVQNQAELCKSGKKDNSENRPGYLISGGICFGYPDGGAEKKTLDLMEMITLGKPVQVEQKFLANTVTIRPLKLFSEPPKTASKYLPTSYSDAGEALTFDDFNFTPYFESGTPTDLAQAAELERRDDLAIAIANEEARLAENERQQRLQQAPAAASGVAK